MTRGVRGSGAPKAPIDYHPFEPGPTRVDANGARRPVCARCGAYRNAWRHRGPESVARMVATKRATNAARRIRPRLIPHPSTPPDLPPAQVDNPRPQVIKPRPVADWRLSMLRLAIDQALEGPELSFLLRRHLLDAKAALRSDLHGTVATELAQVELPQGGPMPPEIERLIVTGQPEPIRPKRSGDGSERLRAMRRAFRGDKYRDLFDAAVAQGWNWERRGDGHVAIYSPEGAGMSLSITALHGRGRGWANAKAQAKRLGLNVEGL